MIAAWAAANISVPSSIYDQKTIFFNQLILVIEGALAPIERTYDLMSIIEKKIKPKRNIYQQPIQSKKKRSSHDVLPSSTGMQSIPSCPSRLSRSSVGIGGCGPAARRRPYYYEFVVAPPDELKRTG